MNIAIDGPAGAGKSTIARLAAKKLGFLYVDTGAMYRAIALYLLWNDTDIDNEEELHKALDRININIVYDKNFLTSAPKKFIKDYIDYELDL